MNSGIPRVTGLLVIEARNSNPNGDPDRESDPRTRAHDGRGVISDVSFKRKMRDLVWNGDDVAAHEEGRSPVWDALKSMMNLDPAAFQIYVCRGRTYREPRDFEAFAEFKKSYWDCRVFGNTVIEKDESEKETKQTKGKKGSGRFIRTGVVMFGLGVSVAKVRIQRDTNTVKAAVQEGKDRGMAPLGFRIVEHGVYVMPFMINPSAAEKSGCTPDDIELLCRLIPYAYPHNASRIRPLVEVRHAWYFEHANPLGSCSEFEILDALTPRKLDPKEPSNSWSDYSYDGTKLLDELKQRFTGKFKQFGDLCNPDFVQQAFPR